MFSLPLHSHAHCRHLVILSHAYKLYSILQRLIYLISLFYYYLFYNSLPLLSFPSIFPLCILAMAILDLTIFIPLCKKVLTTSHMRQLDQSVVFSNKCFKLSHWVFNDWSWENGKLPKCLEKSLYIHPTTVYSTVYSILDL